MVIHSDGSSWATSSRQMRARRRHVTRIEIASHDPRASIQVVGIQLGDARPDVEHVRVSTGALQGHRQSLQLVGRRREFQGAREVARFDIRGQHVRASGRIGRIEVEDVAIDALGISMTVERRVSFGRGSQLSQRRFSVPQLARSLCRAVPRVEVVRVYRAEPHLHLGGAPHVAGLSPAFRHGEIRGLGVGEKARVWWRRRRTERGRTLRRA